MRVYIERMYASPKNQITPLLRETPKFLSIQLAQAMDRLFLNREKYNTSA